MMKPVYPIPMAPCHFSKVAIAAPIAIRIKNLKRFSSIYRKLKRIVRDKKIHVNVLADIESFAASLGFVPEGFCASPIKGGSGNIEYLMKIRKNAGNHVICDFRELAENAFNTL